MRICTPSLPIYRLLTLIRFLIHFLSRSLFVGCSRHTFYNDGDLSSIGPCHQNQKTTVLVIVLESGVRISRGQKKNKSQEFNFKSIHSFNLEWEVLEIALVRFENKKRIRVLRTTLIVICKAIDCTRKGLFSRCSRYPRYR